jgi:hypothetical protein
LLNRERRKSLLLQLWNINGVYKILWQIQEWVPHTKARKILYQYISATTFQGTTPTFSQPQSFRFLSVGTPKTPSVFGFSWRWWDTSPMLSWCLSNHSQPPRDILMDATVHDHTYPSVQWFRRTLWAFVVNCDLINNKKSAVKLGTCFVNVLCQL